MISSPSDLNVQDRVRFRTAAAFLEGRLAEPEILNWALRLRPDRQVERSAILELLTGPGATRLREPYATAWSLTLESWSCPTTGATPAAALQQIRRRLQKGDRSGALIDDITNLLAPRLELKPLQARRPGLPGRKPRRPKKFSDLLSASLSSTSFLIGFQNHRMDFGLDEIADAVFLHALASALMSAIDRGLYIARRIYGDNEDDWYADASPLRVYFVPPEIGVNDWDGPGGRVFEPDAVTPGMGPAVKLLHAVVRRLAELNVGTARSFLWRWRYSDMAIYRRLWAAAARNADAVSAVEAGKFLTALDDNDFWNFPRFPEFAELRAVRFADFETETQALIVRRLRRGLPRRFFPGTMDAEQVRAARRGFSAMELRRIETGGGILPIPDRDWLVEAANEFPGLGKMTIDGGFRDPWVRPCFPPGTASRSRFDDLEGKARLQALEVALSSETSADQASDWLRQSGRAVDVLRDLAGAASLVDRFPRLWDRFGHTHTHFGSQPESETPRDTRSEAVRVLGLLNRLSDATVEAAVGGICHWLYMWSEHVIESKQGQRAWLRAWPVAVEAENATTAGNDRDLADISVRTAGEGRAPEEIDAFPRPVGKLLRVFLELVRVTDESRHPIDDGSLFAQMRDCTIAAPGYSGLIAHCQLTRKLPELLRADPAWARRQLVEPLLADDDKSVLLWRAVASIWIDSEVLKIIGDEVSKRVLDDRLDKEARKDLVSCLVHEGLTAFKDQREPAVSPARISQALRAADDDIREWAALAIRQFQDYEYKVDRGPHTARISFLSAVKPFLEHVWPQERYLATAGVSHQLACLPAVSGEAFSEAVDEIERFLVPFDCSSMLSYGFLEGDMSEQLRMPQLSEAIDDAPKALAFLRLLNLTVGDTQYAAIPDDLGVALDRIESVAPSSISEPAFRRLAAAARR